MDEIINLIIQTIEDNVTLSVPTIDVGQLLPDGGIAVQPAPSAQDMIFLNKKESYDQLLLVLAKSKNQLTAIGDLSRIGKYLSGLTQYPQSANYEWSNTFVSAKPEYVDKEDTGFYIYSMILSNRINEK